MNKMITPFLAQKTNFKHADKTTQFILDLFCPVHWNLPVSGRTIWAPDYLTQLVKKAGIGIFSWIYFQYDFEQQILKRPQSSFPSL